MSELLGIARFRFHEGKREEYLRLTDQATGLVKANEPGTLQYDLYMNADQSERTWWAWPPTRCNSSPHHRRPADDDQRNIAGAP